MKTAQILITISLIMSIGACRTRGQFNNFSSSRDTIVLEAEKEKGLGIFTVGAGPIEFEDTTKIYEYPVIFPKNIENIKLSWVATDLKPFAFENLRKSKSNYLSTFIKNYFPKKIDTLNIPSIKDNSLSIMSGRRGKDAIFIVDENNNKDFRDDSIRLYQKMDWKTTTKLIKCKYNVYNGKVMTEDSDWANIGTLRDELHFFVSHHLESTFSIDNQNYQIGVVDGQPGFTFDEPILALISQNGIKKDTLLEMDLLKKGEYLKLKNSYYRFDDISNDGKQITLIKESDFNRKIGTQVGMIAPDFNCRSTEGDSISFKNYKGKLLLLINVTSCYSPISSYQYYKELSEACKDKFEFFAIDNSPVILNNNIKDLKLTGQFVIAEKNNQIQRYRPGFCSRTCFLINPEGRIIDKFEIFDWKKNLSGYISRK